MKYFFLIIYLMYSLTLFGHCRTYDFFLKLLNLSFIFSIISLKEKLINLSFIFSIISNISCYKFVKYVILFLGKIDTYTILRGNRNTEATGKILIFSFLFFFPIFWVFLIYLIMIQLQWLTTHLAGSAKVGPFQRSKNKYVINTDKLLLQKSTEK